MPLSPQHVVHLEAGIFCSSDPTRKVETCVGCIRREYKRSLRRKDAGLRSGAPSTCTTPGQSRAGSPAFGESAGARLTGSMEADWDEQRIALEKQRIVIFNCSDILDFSKGEVVLPTRVTCYCRHHNEKEGFCICLTLRDAQGNVLATHISPPIMITDDHKSTKFKVERKSTRARAEYDRQDGSAVYANHALAGLASPLGSHPSHLHLVDGSLAGFKGGRQAMSARCSPTLKPYAHHAILDTYSQFASLAGTPSLGNTPLGSPMLSAAAAAAAAAAAVHMGGFDTPFHLPQAAAYAPTPAQSSASMYGSLSSASQLGAYSVPNSATGAGPALQMAPAYAGLGAASSGSLLFGDGGSAMQVSQLWPVQGPVAGGISVLVCGRGFHGNIAVYFGGVPAGRVQVLSPSNISCVLPPTKTAGPAALRIRDLVTGAVCDGEAVFSYVEDTDHTMLGLALHVTGLRQNPAQEKLGGSPRVSPVLGESPGSPQHQRRSPPSAAGAKMLQDAAVVATLQQLRAASEGRRLVEIEAGLVALFAMLLGKGMLDISRLALRHEATGRTLLHFAALLGMLNLVSFLAAHGVSLDDVDHNGMSPMHFASMYGRADIVELLLSRGAQHGV
ncbi:SPT3 Dosage dependent suppressor of Ty-induced promoter mutations-like protein, partial [Coemansia furcata]